MPLIGILTLLFTACSKDDDSSTTDPAEDLVLPKTIRYTYIDYPEDNSAVNVTYNENKIVEVLGVDGSSKSVFTYDGDFISQIVDYDIDENGNEVFDFSNTYTYKDGKLSSALSKEVSSQDGTEFYVQKTVYSHDSDEYVSYVMYDVNEETNEETKYGEGRLYFKDGNLVKDEEFYEGESSYADTYEYDDKKSPLSNVLGYNLLLDNSKEISKNNVVKESFSYSSGEPNIDIYEYEYNEDGYPIKKTEIGDNGEDYIITEYTY
ncbi:hypothetical protein [Galbibacter mesophilus]|uniref:hypothetical protein n=1 Tax=Galbibacter mesophilus TaxID=379069 RepID=UPI00191F9276|nr:hypothetical protein [Galbibacter mesophilus]MCM5661538.1 hypothetical protein [Galbibacter mesophilus]